MPFLLAIIAALLGWAIWSGRIKWQQLPPIILGIAGAGLAVKGSLIAGIAIMGVAAAWYRGLNWRIFGLNGKQSRQYKIDKARNLLGTGVYDDAEKIKARHRKLITENHPDKGGSAERASALNEARDLLLAELQKQQH
jgi:hypothetical protein